MDPMPRKSANKAKSTRQARPKDSPKKTGRPSSFSPEIAERICNEIMDGKSVRSICTASDMPPRSTVMRWIRENEAFRNQYAQAKEEGADALVEDILDIADDGSNDFVEDDEGNLKFNSEAVQRSKLRVDTRKWIASRLKPKKYGDKLDMNHGIQPGDPLAEILAGAQGTALKPVARPSAGGEE